VIPRRKFYLRANLFARLPREGSIPSVRSVPLPLSGGGLLVRGSCGSVGYGCGCTVEKLVEDIVNNYYDNLASFGEKMDGLQ
jgi:CO dehydrogenase nickel-insertion accessory protein CooC1